MSIHQQTIPFTRTRHEVSYQDFCRAFAAGTFQEFTNMNGYVVFGVYDPDTGATGAHNLHTFYDYKKLFYDEVINLVLQSRPGQSDHHDFHHHHDGDDHDNGPMSHLPDLEAIPRGRRGGGGRIGDGGAGAARGGGDGGSSTKALNVYQARILCEIAQLNGKFVPLSLEHDYASLLTQKSSLDKDIIETYNSLSPLHKQQVIELFEDSNSRRGTTWVSILHRLASFECSHLLSEFLHLSFHDERFKNRFGEFVTAARLNAPSAEGIPLIFKLLLVEKCDKNVIDALITKGLSLTQFLPEPPPLTATMIGNIRSACQPQISQPYQPSSQNGMNNANAMKAPSATSVTAARHGAVGDFMRRGSQIQLTPEQIEQLTRPLPPPAPLPPFLLTFDAKNFNAFFQKEHGLNGVKRQNLIDDNKTNNAYTGRETDDHEDEYDERDYEFDDFATTNTSVNKYSSKWSSYIADNNNNTKTTTTTTTTTVIAGTNTNKNNNKDNDKTTTIMYGPLPPPSAYPDISIHPSISFQHTESNVSITTAAQNTSIDKLLQIAARQNQNVKLTLPLLHSLNHPLITRKTMSSYLKHVLKNRFPVVQTLLHVLFDIPPILKYHPSFDFHHKFTNEANHAPVIMGGAGLANNMGMGMGGMGLLGPTGASTGIMPTRFLPSSNINSTMNNSIGGSGGINATSTTTNTTSSTTNTNDNDDLLSGTGKTSTNTTTTTPTTTTTTTTTTSASTKTLNRNLFGRQNTTRSMFPMSSVNTPDYGLGVNDMMFSNTPGQSTKMGMRGLGGGMGMGMMGGMSTTTNNGMDSLFGDSTSDGTTYGNGYGLGEQGLYNTQIFLDEIKMPNKLQWPKIYRNDKNFRRLQPTLEMVEYVYNLCIQQHHNLLSLRDETGCTPFLKFFRYKSLVLDDLKLPTDILFENLKIAQFLLSKGAYVDDVQTPLGLVYQLLPEEDPQQQFMMNQQHHNTAVSNALIDGIQHDDDLVDEHFTGVDSLYDLPKGFSFDGDDDGGIQVKLRGGDGDDSDSDDGFTINVRGNDDDHNMNDYGNNNNNNNNNNSKQDDYSLKSRDLLQPSSSVLGSTHNFFLGGKSSVSPTNNNNNSVKIGAGGNNNSGSKNNTKNNKTNNNSLVSSLSSSSSSSLIVKLSKMLPQQYIFYKQVHLMYVLHIMSLRFTNQTPLLLICQNFTPSSIDDVLLELLLTFNANPNHVSLNEDTALKILTKQNAKQRQASIFNLLKYGACARYDGRYKINFSPLYQCISQRCDVSIVRALIFRGANPNKVLEAEPGPLFHAIKLHLQHAKRSGESDTSVVRLLLQSKANVNEIDQDHETVLMKAVKTKNCLNLVKLLVASGSNLSFHNAREIPISELALLEYQPYVRP